MKTESLLRELEARRLWLATVESCTGGRIASRITAISGSSKAYWGGWVVYDNTAKISQLGIAPELIEAHGAVSSEVAQSLAHAGLKAMQVAQGPGRAGICVSTTGVAGPSGGSTAKPVGLCYVGIAASGFPARSLEIRAPEGGSRDQNQEYFADAALAAVTELLAEIKKEGARA
jgi:nicotinamide-nucleotide amidase